VVGVRVADPDRIEQIDVARDLPERMRDRVAAVEQDRLRAAEQQAGVGQLGVERLTSADEDEAGTSWGLAFGLVGLFGRGVSLANSAVVGE
jgi:hypothetical protein